MPRRLCRFLGSVPEISQRFPFCKCVLIFLRKLTRRSPLFSVTMTFKEVLYSSNLFLSIIFGVATVITLLVIKLQKMKTKLSDTFHPSAHLKCQSVIIDDKKHLRTAAVGRKHPELNELKTTKEIFRHALEVARNHNCFGWRTDFNSPPKWITYEEAYQTIKLIGSALVYLNEPSNEGNHFVGICGRNSPERVYTQHACGNYGLVTVPLYDTLGDEAIVHIIKQTELKMAVCDTAARARNLLKCSAKPLKQIVVWQNDSDLIKLRSEQNDLPIISFEELLEIGRNHLVSEKDVQADDLFLICYTSGTTDLPKGVFYTHKQFMNCIARCRESLDDTLSETAFENHLSYLPLSHVMEQFLMNVALFYGSSVAFLTKNITGLSNDLAFYRPTVFCAVPRIYCRIYSDTVKGCTSRFSRWLLDYSVQQKLKEQKRGIYTRYGLLDYLFFRQIRKQIGDRVKVVVSGSAPLQPEVLNFLKAAFSCPVLEGYGSTETGGLVCYSLIGDTTTGHVGALSVGVTAKLVDVPDMDILVTRDGMGEVCILSDGITSGYYRDEAKTKELFDDEGFIRTGDVGMWMESGALKIVDRCKNMFKLSQGEYVAPERVENIYLTSPLINCIYVEGKSLHAFTVGVVVPNWSVLRSRLTEKVHANSGLQRSSQPTNTDLCADKRVRNLILSELHTVGKQKGLKGFEQVKVIHVAVEPFTVDNGLLTPTMKLSRPAVRRRYAKLVDDMYASTN
ncbi:Long-chain-fatty-acid--CoA ligase [Fasciola gigantica]|uniref:long-chain-fatty-acid--CoA ligase n=1 Tax=Fasciola gigantica TaxID=46835 RepID=A0A504YRD2_FASGI|nr:Long-chain-fatty-acid--CoA ligase [Fasciola gigantica]